MRKTTAYLGTGRRNTKKECKKARLKTWRDLQTNIEGTSDMNKFQKNVQWSEHVTLGTITKENGEQTKSGIDTIEYLSQVHFNKATPLKPTQYKPDRISKVTVDSWDNNINTEEKVLAAFKTFKIKKSLGSDGIHPAILQQLPGETITYITKLYRICVLLGYTPTRWKECKIECIPKPGKGSYQIAKAWRPISLTNYLLKALEKLCCRNMDAKIELNPIHTRQHGFRTDRNTETSISNVVKYIETHIHQEQHVLAVFLDIQAAFDTIDPKQVKNALLLHGGDPTMVKWYYNYITHRNLHIEVKGSEAKLSTSTGFPQGGVCSAKFWIVAFNEAIQILNKHGVYGNGFADDCVALIGGSNTDQMMSRMQKVVNSFLIRSRAVARIKQ